MNLIPHGLGSLIRFLIGILLVQGVTALLVYTALSTDWTTTWPLFALLGCSIGVLSAFWFNTIVSADRHRAVSRLSERFSKERERFKVKAEQQRAKVRKSGSLGASLKTGVVVGGAVGLGTAMMLAQFVTLGLITLSAAGGAALGYGVRARQEKIIANKRLAAEERALQAIEVETIGRALPHRRDTDRPKGDA